jgi:hypothetical protein
MLDLNQHAKAKSEEFIREVTSDSRWKLDDELMCQVLGFTLYGYVFGIGRVHCFMDVGDIHAIIIAQLTDLGAGRKYVEGLVQAAHHEFTTENNQSWQNRLIGVGHSHALKEDMNVLVDSIFSNTAASEGYSTAGASAPLVEILELMKRPNKTVLRTRPSRCGAIEGSRGAGR